MSIQQSLDILRSIAPESLAEPWDHVGLQVGSLNASTAKPSPSTCRGLLCIDLTPAVLREAVQGRVNLIVAYHPPIFDPLASLTDRTWKERLLLELVQRNMAVYSPHTALDATAGGINDWLCDAVLPGTWAASMDESGELAGRLPGGVEPIQPAAIAQADQPCKLVTYVPSNALESLRQALWSAGAGHIGRYDQCSFSHAGEGTFRGEAGTHPTVGQAGRWEKVQEIRLEMIVPAQRVNQVVAALKQAHPYEEPAFDLYRLQAPAGQIKRRVGQGRIVTLHRSLTLSTLTGRLKRWLKVDRLQVAPGVGGARKIKRVAVCAGAGGSLFKNARLADVDVLITGEMRHHDVLDAVQQGQSVLLAGHTQTERPYLPAYLQRIVQAGGRPKQWRISRADRASW